jgi:internalin A
VRLQDARLPGIPAEVLADEYNCLPALRAHLQDLAAAGPATLTDVKLMVLGNGRVGKTQICQLLRGEGYDDQIPSNHGIMVDSAPLPQGEGRAPLWLHLWDFGGQDIYHGTHALFLRTRAILMVVWTPELEDAAEYEMDGMSFRNHPLDYWLSYVRHLGGPESPVLVVQARCDGPEDEARRLPVGEEALEGFPYLKSLHYSALNDRGRAALDEALRDAAAWLHGDARQGVAQIGAGRLRVQRRLEALRDADAKLPQGERQHRTLTQAHYRQICLDEGGVSAPEHLLQYLHNAGVVFYRQGLFEDRILLDQGWCLEAIYTVFHRQHCYRQLHALHGRFHRSLLGLLAWPEYGPEEQALFLSMMESCGICFVHHRGGRADGDEAEYIAPDLLPEKAALAGELEARWDEAAPKEEATLEYDFHEPALLRGLMSRLGKQAGINAIYWRGGFCLYEHTTRSRALIEQACGEGWGGSLRLRTQGGQAAALLERLLAEVEDGQGEWGVSKPPRAISRRGQRGQRQSPIRLGPDNRSAAEPMETEEVVAPPPLKFVQEPKTQREFFVSYAWGDETPEGRERVAPVDAVCAAARERGMEVLRDRDVLHPGDRISRFMARIGGGDRILVVLSDKYLQSPYCMFELFEIWRNSDRDPEAMLERLRIFALPDARYSSIADRLDWAGYWSEERDKINQRIAKYGADKLADRDLPALKQIAEFSHNVGNVLAALADVVRPTTIAGLTTWSLDDW